MSLYFQASLRASVIYFSSVLATAVFARSDPGLELAENIRVSGISGITASIGDSVIYAPYAVLRKLQKYVKNHVCMEQPNWLNNAPRL